jgi:hypothetical protein
VKTRDETTELVVRQTYEESPGELSSKNPMVLSCGGIYIPQRRLDLDKPIWQVLNLPDGKRLTKVVSSGLPKSALTEMLEKESMN